MAGIKDWSKTAASNNQTPPFGWPENMAPSNVNNTARQDRADVRDWYVDAAWVNPGGTPTYVSATQFTIADDSEITDYSQYYSVSRRIRITSGANTVYAKITTVAYSAPTTTVDFTVVEGTMDVSISAVEYSVIQDNKALPDGAPVDPASETTQGIVYLATTAEAEAGTNDADAMTPLKTKQLLQSSVGSTAVLPKNYIEGIVPANGTDTAHDIDFGTGVARDSSNAYVIDFSSSVTKQADADWASGTNAGGMPATTTETGTFLSSGTSVTGTGSAFDTEFEVGDILYSNSKSEGRRITVIGGPTSITLESAFSTDVLVADNVQKNALAPNATYHLFVLYKSSDGTTDAGFDTQTDAVNLLKTGEAAQTAGFDQYRRVGSVITDASANILLGKWTELSGGGLDFDLDVWIQDYGANPGATTAFNVDLSVPVGIKFLSKTVSIPYSGATAYTLMSDLDQTDTTPTRNYCNIHTNSQDGNDKNHVYTNTKGQVRLRTTNGAVTHYVNTAGFIDERIS